ncbi:MAG TPA: hypothetical protein DCR46_00115, partial [Cytophagales bacterium]|nr:hypothetical protein [Cytophagales bacterium]
GIDTSYKVLRVSPNNIKPFYNADVVEGCQPLTVHFTNYSSGATHSTWDFGDGTVGYDFDATHTYTKAGDYYVKMYADNGCAYDSTKSLTKITVYPLPDVKISDPDTIDCIGKFISFKPIPTNLKSYLWDFGDNSPPTATLQPAHSFNEGRFRVRVMGESSKGCINYDSVYVRIFSPPVTQFSVDTAVGCQPFNVKFTNTTTNATNYFWTFGDGGSVIGDSLNLQYLYLKEGAYKAKLFSSNLGCRDSVEKTITVLPKPTSTFITNPASSCSFPVIVQTKNQSKNALFYEWFFDGINQSTTFNSPVVKYLSQGSYPITLIAISEKGCRDTSSNTFNVIPPKADFEAKSPIVCQNSFFSLLNKSTNADTYYWDFGDNKGEKITELPVYRYKNTGFYTIKLKVTKDGTCVDSITKNNYIEVSKLPLAAFDYDIDYDVPEVAQVIFLNKSMLGTKFYWEFDDVDTTSQVNPVYPYNKLNAFHVQLVAQNDVGCTDTVTKKIVFDLIKTLYVPTALTPGMGSRLTGVFLPKGKGLKNYTLQIFDQFGSVIWESSKLRNGIPAEAWDGTDLNGNPLPPDVYVWKVNAEFEDGTFWKGQKLGDSNTTKPIGTVTLIR